MSEKNIVSVVKPTWRQLKEFIEALPDQYLDTPVVWWGIEEAGGVDEVITLEEKHIWTPEGYVPESDFDKDGDLSIEERGDINNVLEAGYPIIWIEKPINVNKVFELDHGETYWISAPSSAAAIEHFKKSELPGDPVSATDISEVPYKLWETIEVRNPDDETEISNVADWMKKHNEVAIICSTAY